MDKEGEVRDLEEDIGIKEVDVIEKRDNEVREIEYKEHIAGGKEKNREEERKKDVSWEGDRIGEGGV